MGGAERAKHNRTSRRREGITQHTQLSWKPSRYLRVSNRPYKPHLKAALAGFLSLQLYPFRSRREREHDASDKCFPSGSAVEQQTFPCGSKCRPCMHLSSHLSCSQDVEKKSYLKFSYRSMRCDWLNNYAAYQKPRNCQKMLCVIGWLVKRLGDRGLTA